jgi:hypothetical protein
VNADIPHTPASHNRGIYCPCPKCKASRDKGKYKRTAIHAARHQDQTRTLADNHRQPWDADEEAQLWDGTTTEVALRLGRTWGAVHSRRTLTAPTNRHEHATS